MSTIHIFILAIVQGLTEFLPVSSSGHLNLVHLLTSFPDQGPLIDVAVHVGSLGAVLIYFWRDVLGLVHGALDLVRGRWNERSRLVVWLILASIPVFVVGFVLLQSGAVNAMRTIMVVAVANLLFAILLYLADRAPAERDMGHIGLGKAMIIGAAQVLALVPGVSRSGITMTAARYLGITRTDAARFSMLLAIPTLLGAGAGAGLEIYKSGDALLWEQAGLAAGLSFVTAFIAIWAMMAWLRRMTFTPFVIYRVLLSLALLAVVALAA